ncbi:hypothetical protein LNL84_17470 [Vibrio sp. ZSDZ34]|uniref:Glycosyltransferase family 9 protein n=1 Tax=Vibrio gelatinilyticus TaxID=2893468 RepID=A0A9X1WDI1_9VIBR|nr:glycosyltransferase family 9 protein [Vibrio gelatinilyticus]MCJ2378603.1 hypothetical protein [Vibrio gelatinilyticus]
MSKPKWLKSSYIKARFSQLFVSVFKRHNQTLGNGILITSTDGLGDAFMRLSLVYHLCQKNGFDNVWVVSKPPAIPLYQALGIQVIKYTDRNRTSPFKRLALVNELNRLPIDKVLALEFTRNEDLIDLIVQKNKIGFSHNGNPENDRQLSEVVTNPGYAGDALTNMSQHLGSDVKLMDNTDFLSRFIADIKPQIINTQQEQLHVVLAVGAAASEKMMRISNIVKIMEALYSAYPNIHFTLIGFGKRDDKYTKLIEKHYKAQNLQNLVSKASLKETIEIVANCDLLIGFDSGMYNLAFTLKKPTICFATHVETALHEADCLRVIRGTDTEYGVSDEYGCKRTNSVYPEVVISQFEELQKITEK